MSWEVKEVPVEYVNKAWSEVEHFLVKSVAYSKGELTIEETKMRLLDGSWILFVALDDVEEVKGAATVCFYNRMDNRVAYVTNIGGRLLADLETFSHFCEHLKKHGATCIEGAVRESLMRLWARLGARKKTTIVQISL